MKLKFLSKFLLGVLMVCGIMFVAGCSYDDDDNGGGGIDAGKTGEIPGVYVYSYQEDQDGVTFTFTHTLTLKSSNDPESGKGTISWYDPNSGAADDLAWQINGSGNFEICKIDGSARSCGGADFDGADIIIWDGDTYKRKGK